MEQKSQNSDFQNDWAYNENFTYHIHISEAKSGLNGYYCLGCKKEMQAAKGLKRIHYFRHHAKNVDKDNTECVVASRNYRELIARDILQRLKQLKVPDVYKFPSMGQGGKPMLLQKSETIVAHKVKSEITFYEDENCVVQFGQNPEVDQRFLLIRPDITFFNKKEEPILLIEFVVTHKIDDEKRLKLKRLGLNTVQIIIPKRPENEIEAALKSQTKVKWVYNEIEANTEYIFVSEATNNGIWSIDDDQRNIFEESYKCRASQLKYLIRSVKRALESQSYNRTEQLFESEISRVEKATAAEQQRLGKLETGIDNEVQLQYADQFIELDRQRGKLDESEKEFRRHIEGLEERYRTKDDKIRGEQEEIRGDQEGLNDIKRRELENGGTEESIRERFRRAGEELRHDFEITSEDLKRSIDREIEYKGKLSEDEAKLPGFFKQLESKEYENFAIERDRNRNWFRALNDGEERILSEDISKEEASLKELQLKEGTLAEEFGELEERERARFREEEASLIAEEKRYQESIREELIKEFRESTTELPKRLKFLLEAQRVGCDYKTAQRQEQYYQRARDFFNKGTWEKK